MTPLKPKYLYNNVRLLKSADYWYDVIMGGLLTATILISIGTLFLIKLNLTSWVFPYSLLCIGVVAYYQWRDDNLTIIETGLSKGDNYDLVTTCLNRLNWKFDKKQTEVNLTLNKYILKFLQPTIIPESNNIYINFKYHSTTKTGRLPFFFGISTYLEWRFKKSMRALLSQQIA